MPDGVAVAAPMDEAQRLLRRKLPWARHADGPDAFPVFIAELYDEQERLRKEVAGLQQRTQQPLRGCADENLRAARVWQLPRQHPSA